jgi:hypothetical protein
VNGKQQFFAVFKKVQHQINEFELGIFIQEGVLTNKKWILRTAQYHPDEYSLAELKECTVHFHRSVAMKCLPSIFSEEIDLI